MRCMFRQHRQRQGKRGSAENRRRTSSVVNRHGFLKNKQASRLVSTPRGRRGRVVASLGSEAAAPTRRAHGGALLKQNWPSNGPQANMRVPDHSSADPDPHTSPQASAEPAAQTPENGRSRRRRVPKTCDCCGPNSGHAPEKTANHTHHGVKRRGRRKKEESVAKVMTETEMTVDMQEEVEPEEVKGQEQGQAEGQSEAQGSQQDIPAADASDHQAANQVTALNPVKSHDKSHDPSVSELPPSGLVNGTAESSAGEGEMEVETPLVNHCVPPPGDHHYCKRQLDLHHPPDTHTHTHSPDRGPEAVVDLIHEYLEDFYVKYGSFIPLCEAELHDYLNRKYNTDLSDRKLVHSEVLKYKAGLACVSMQHFKVTHNKHTLNLEDLATLDQHNWLNDQVINMYGELIMEAVSHKVHFFNSFFYRQLVAKGYEGVKRWTKKVDVFSKRLLLVPLHLEVHWSLVAVDVSSKSLHFYDSQGIMFKYAVDNILKYLLAEAKEKKQLGFQKGWKMLINKCIPQQKNDSDCGVFVLEYCKCLALRLPLQFSQEDMPKVRKRIYQELCECKLKD